MWIKLSDRHPDDDSVVLVHAEQPDSGKRFMYSIRYKNGEFITKDKVTHWQPLPAAPAEAVA